MRPLVGFHLRSFARFVQQGVDPSGRCDAGLQGALDAVFPVRSGDEIASLECVGYSLERPRFDEGECLRRGLTLASPLKVTIRLIIFDPPEAPDGPWTIRDIKEQECYFGEVPCMTGRGTFVLDGVERVLTPFVVPAPGVRRVHTEDGPVVTFHDALGNALELTRAPSSDAVVLRVRPGPFTAHEALLPGRHARTLHLRPEGVYAPFDDAPSAGRAAPWDVIASDGRVVVAKGQKLSPRRVAALRESGLPGVPLSARDTRLHRTARAVRSPNRAVLVAAHRTLLAAAVGQLLGAGVTEVAAYLPDGVPAAHEPTPVADADAAMCWVHDHLVRFDLGVHDLEAAFEWLAAPDRGDPVDSAPYAVIAAGEALTGATLRGLWKMAREARARLDRGENDTLMPCDLINARALMRAFRELLESPTTSAPWAQRNPLAALGHLRRVALGAGVVWPGAVEGFVSLPPDVVVGPLGEVALPRDGSRAAWEGAFSQAEPLLQPEAPADNDDADVLHATGAVTLAEHDGQALVVDDRVVLVVPDDPEAPVQVHALTGFVATCQATSRAERAAVADGARVHAGDRLVEGEAVVAGALALGRSVRVAFSDALAEGEARVSERVLREGWFTSRWVPTRVVVLCDTAYGWEELVATPPDAEGHAARHLDASGIVTLGAAVNPGDVLVGVRSPGPNGAWAGTSLRAPEAAPATVRHVQVLARRGYERCPRHEALVEAERALWEAVAGRACAAMGPEAAGAFEALSDLCRRRIDTTYRGDDLPPGVATLVRVTLEIARELAAGDLLVDRHGLVATVGAVAPDDTMPALADGSRADVLLSAAGALPEGTRAEASGGVLYLAKIPRR